MEKNNIEEIQNTMFLIYSKNLNFFKNDYPEIYMKISDLEKKNIYEYSIDFINNHFELVNNKMSIFIIVTHIMMQNID